MLKNASESDMDQDVVILMEVRYSNKKKVVKECIRPKQNPLLSAWPHNSERSISLVSTRPCLQENSGSINNTWIQNPALAEWQQNPVPSCTLLPNSTPAALQQNPGPSTTATISQNPMPATWKQSTGPSNTTWMQNFEPAVWQQNQRPSNTTWMQNFHPAVWQQNQGLNNITWMQNLEPAAWQKNPGSSFYPQSTEPGAHKQTLLPSIDQDITMRNQQRERNVKTRSPSKQNPGLFTSQQVYEDNGTHVLVNETENDDGIGVAVKKKHKRKAEDLKNSNKKSKNEKLPNLNENGKNGYEKLIDLENVIVVNSEDSKCLRCFKDVASGNGVVLHECLHSFCRSCLISEIENSILPLIQCPSRNQNYICDAHLLEKEIKLLVPADIYERHLQLSATIAEVRAENTYHCNTTGCKGWCFYEEGAENFFCQMCRHVNCLVCFAIHEDKSCEEYQQDSDVNINNKFMNVNTQSPSSSIEEGNVFLCRFPDCTGSCLIDEDGIFICNICHFVNCISCEAIHEGQSCKEYQDNVQSHASSKHLRSGENNIENDYEKLMKLSTVLVPNFEPFTCMICFENIPRLEGVTLHECFHNFCRECLILTVKHSETPVVRCPFVDKSYMCESSLKELEIKSLVSPEVYEKHLHRSVTIAEGCAENSFHCKTADCPGWCLHEEDVQFFNCPVCNHQNCVVCGAIHENLTCQAYQKSKINAVSDDDQQKKSEEHIQNLIKAGKAMPCPKCKIILEKNRGCDGITCSVCKTEVCWATKGPRWGPDGKGDTSGGCRCMVGGKRCHKKCKHCH